MAPSGWWQHFSYNLGFPTFAMGSPLRGRGLFVLDRNKGLVSSFGSGTLVISWLALTPLSAASARPVLRCVRELRLSLASSSVLHCPMLGFSVAPTTLAAGLGLSWVPCPTFCRLGFCTSVGGSTCALQLLTPSYRVVLTDAAGLGRFLVLSIVLPWP